jgi:hypothetical protein
MWYIVFTEIYSGYKLLDDHGHMNAAMPPVNYKHVVLAYVSVLTLQGILH